MNIVQFRVRPLKLSTWGYRLWAYHEHFAPRIFLNGVPEGWWPMVRMTPPGEYYVGELV